MVSSKIVLLLVIGLIYVNARAAKRQKKIKAILPIPVAPISTCGCPLDISCVCKPAPVPIGIGPCTCPNIGANIGPNIYLDDLGFGVLDYGVLNQPNYISSLKLPIENVLQGPALNLPALLNVIDLPNCQCQKTLCQCQNYPICQCQNVPVCQCQNYPLCQCQNVPICQCQNLPLCQCQNGCQLMPLDSCGCKAVNTQRLPYDYLNPMDLSAFNLNLPCLETIQPLFIESPKCPNIKISNGIYDCGCKNRCGCQSDCQLPVELPSYLGRDVACQLPVPQPVCNCQRNCQLPVSQSLCNCQLSAPSGCNKFLRQITLQPPFL